MKKIVSFLFGCTVLFVCSLGTSGCVFDKENPYPYKGEYKELYTTAIYSIPDAEGFMHHGEGAYDSDIYIWEKDNYGRTLFSYCEDYGNKIFGLVLCQTYDDTNVYFYPDINYALTFIDSVYLYEGVGNDYLKDKTEDFYLENKEKLKEENDWNQPLNMEKCVSYSITEYKDLKDNVYPLSSMQCNEILNEYTKTLNLRNPDEFPHKYNNILQVDAEGKILHEIRGVHQYYDNPNWDKTDEYTFYDIVLWIITDKDGNYDKDKGVLVMYSKANETDNSFIYNAEDILEFKNQNNWKN